MTKIPPQKPTKPQIVVFREGTEPRRKKRRGIKLGTTQIAKRLQDLEKEVTLFKRIVNELSNGIRK